MSHAKGRGKLGLEIVFLKNFNSLKIFTVHTVHSFKKVLFQLSLNNRFNLGFIVATAGYHHVNFNSIERRAGQLGREGGEVACSSIQNPTPLAHPPPRSASRASFSPHHPADKTRSRSINAKTFAIDKSIFDYLITYENQILQYKIGSQRILNSYTVH